MTEKSAPQGGRTSWKRFALAIVPVTAAVVGLGAAMAEGAVPATFVISNAEAKISAKSLDGKGFTQYGWVMSRYNEQGKEVAIPVARAAMKTAELEDMCQSVKFTIPVVGEVTLRIEAGKTKKVKAENMFIDMNQLRGEAKFKEIEIGRDASTLNKGPKGGAGFQGTFAQQADEIYIEDLRQTMYATQASSFALSGLHLAVTTDKGKECF